jgi:type II secretory pathway pseudopilin PulG
MKRTAFTLVELLVAISLTLILLLGINQVFKMTTDTVGAGQALNAASRDLRGAQSVFFNDLHGAVTSNAPAFIIYSQQTTAFRNRADELADRDYAAASAAETAGPSVSNAQVVDDKIRTIDLDNNGTEGENTVSGEVISPALYGDRSHRTDKLMFFARGYFPRQTGDDGTFAANMSSNEAYIVYGHLALPDNATPAIYHYPGPSLLRSYLFPGTAAETFATNPNNFYASQWMLGRSVILLRSPSSGEIRDNSNQPQFYFGQASGIALSPLSQFAQPTENGTSFDATYRLENSRYDLAGTTIDDFRTTISDYIATGSSPAWWYLMGNWRFQGNLFPTKPLNSEGVAKTVPLFMANCSQFIVEYAGDFLTQDKDPSSGTYGKVTAWGADGKVDFVVVNGLARTRWYGMPRDTDTDGVILGNSTDTNFLVDVVPMSDVLLTAGIAIPSNTPERAVPTRRNNYADPAAGMDRGAQYVAAWGPDTTGLPAPKMLRIVATMDDPAGRMANPQTMEYVVDLP